MFLSFFGNHCADIVIISGVMATPPADRHMADKCIHLWVGRKNSSARRGDVSGVGTAGATEADA